jgi:hypothetical protein
MSPSFNTGSFGTGPYGLTPAMPPAAYCLSLTTSEYQNSPQFLAFAAALLQPIIDIGNCAASMNPAFALNSPPVENQLNVYCRQRSGTLAA